MSRRSLFASILMACLLTAGLWGLVPVANAASAGQSLLNSGESARNNVIEIQYRRRGPVMYLPKGPGSIYDDYPYYYSRGYYPTHIGPHYIYYGPGYVTYRNRFYGSGYYPRYSGRCSSSHRRCAASWGHRNEDY